ncbi:hypothetical protein A0H81_11020 [Grifola frondosa]|uniref:Uncharacterized protein n=1 Tax=Grifola frondosa TaxID=5627 RepID=A0A1C7LW88_GRIFR|nr:hypothetical protein A0H81_11020 [Grifola frondosa]
MLPYGRLTISNLNAAAPWSSLPFIGRFNRLFEVENFSPPNRANGLRVPFSHSIVLLHNLSTAVRGTLSLQGVQLKKPRVNNEGSVLYYEDSGIPIIQRPMSLSSWFTDASFTARSSGPCFLTLRRTIFALFS